MKTLKRFTLAALISFCMPAVAADISIDNFKNGDFDAILKEMGGERMYGGALIDGYLEDFGRHLLTWSDFENMRIHPHTNKIIRLNGHITIAYEPSTITFIMIHKADKADKESQYTCSQPLAFLADGKVIVPRIRMVKEHTLGEPLAITGFDKEQFEKLIEAKEVTRVTCEGMELMRKNIQLAAKEMFKRAAPQRGMTKKEMRIMVGLEN